MIKLLTLSLVIFITGCASAQRNNYSACLETQKSISKDMVVMEAARVQALIEMTKSSDPSVRSSAAKRC